MVNVNFWQIYRTYSLSVLISWCSYYHYLSLHHDSFWVPVQPHCAKYYRNTSLALLVWPHSSRSATFMYLLPCYSNIFFCSTNGMFKALRRRDWGEWSNKIIWFLIHKCPCSTLYCTDRKIWLVLCWMCKYPSMFCKLPHTCWFQYDLQSKGVLRLFPLYRWDSDISVGSSLIWSRCWMSVMWV